MIIYSNTKKQFINDVQHNIIDEVILEHYIRETGHRVGSAEQSSWRNSLRFMKDVIEDPEIPDDSGIAIEYVLPQSAKRIDFIITGKDEKFTKNMIIVELKQWEKVYAVVGMDGIVRTYLGKKLTDTPHPSYQALSYAQYLKDYNTAINAGNISLIPCAYLHNYRPDNQITHEIYKSYISEAPIFLKFDAPKLRDFIKKYIRYGDIDIIYDVENGRLKPSKELIQVVASMLEGNQEFILLDEQKVVYEKALMIYASIKRGNSNKEVVIVKGGPGTGKSVLAINLLSRFIQQGAITKYVTKNAAPRKVFIEKLTRQLPREKMRIVSLFSSSDNFYDISSNTYDVLIVDEAHRLRAKSGMYQNKGENQVKEIINASKLSIFFIDEDQRVTLQDIGSVDEIKKWAKYYNAHITELELTSQFRCNGSDGYLAWIDNTLQIRQTANFTLKGINYDFKVFDNPQELHDTIIKLNNKGLNARMLAGYAWEWVSKKNPSLYDFEIGNYKARWNLFEHGGSWIIRPNSVNEIGCIHTCQGLELDYAGIIIGPDLIVRDGEVITNYKMRAIYDSTLKGIKKMAKEKGEEFAQKKARPIILNTYKVLFTRAMKGTYIYSEDEETREYFKVRMGEGM